LRVNFLKIDGQFMRHERSANTTPQAVRTQLHAIGRALAVGYAMPFETFAAHR
jgi:hypothetical protein